MAPRVVLNPARISVIPKVGKNEPIRANELAGRIDVKIDEPGCYAVELSLWHQVLTGPDVQFGHQTGRLTCWCFLGKEGRSFNYHGGAAPPKGQNPIDIDKGAGNPDLDPIVGEWPSSAGAFDNWLSVYVKARVFKCSNRGCTDDADCGELIPDGSSKPVASERTSTYQVHVYNGDGIKKGIDLIEHGISIVKGLGGLLESLAPIARRLDALEDRVADLERRLEREEGLG